MAVSTRQSRVLLSDGFLDRRSRVSKSDAGSTGSDRLRAVLEGVVFNVVRLFESLREGPVSRVVLSGSLTRLDFVQTVLAALIDAPVFVDRDTNATLRGAIRLYRWTNVIDENKNVEETPIALPNSADVEALRRKYADWKALIASRLT